MLHTGSEDGAKEPLAEQQHPLEQLGGGGAVCVCVCISFRSMVFLKGSLMFLMAMGCSLKGVLRSLKGVL